VYGGASLPVTVENIMNINNKETLKAHIRKKISHLKDGIQSFQALSGPVAPDNAIGRLTRMEAINSKSINEAALKKAEQTLLRMERALAMIDAPDFGLCRECEEPIPFERIMIVPESDLCVQCAEALEV
jgi:DnaK suppressor protein